METFKENGSYNKTNWEIGDIITTERLNKIEDALYEINENSNDINKLDLNNYATKAEIPTNVSALNNDIGYVTQNHTHNNYVTREEISTVPTHVSQLINDAGYVTQYHTHNNYATKTELSDAIASIEIGDIDLSNYATKADLNNKANLIHSHDQYLTEHQDLSSYATKTYVDNAIANIDIPETNNNCITSNNITRIEVVTQYPAPEDEETGVLYIKVSE